MLLHLWVLVAFAAAAQSPQGGGNPIRKVVNMLNMMKEKVQTEAKAEEKLYDAYMCYCTQNDAEVSKAVDVATEHIPQLEATVKEASSMKSQLQTELKDHKADRTQNLASLEKANKIRDKEHAQYVTDSTDLKTNVAALGKAVAALEKNLAGAAFLQTVGQVLAPIKTLVEASNELTEDDRSQVTSFLMTGQAESGSSGEILGILKTMQEETQKDLNQMIVNEQERAQAHEELLASKKKEIESTTATIENKTERVGVLAVKESENKDDREETEKTLVKDQEFLTILRESCTQQEKAWAVRQQTRSEELTALAETIKILNDDDALDLFKTTMKDPSVIGDSSSLRQTFCRSRTAYNSVFSL